MASPLKFLVVVGLELVARASAQSLLSNGGFESSSNLDSWNCYSVAANSTFTGCAVDTGSGGPSGHLASEGSNNAIIWPGSVLSQNTSAKAGATYLLTFDAYALDEWLGEPAVRPNLQLSFSQGGAPAWNVDVPDALYLSSPNGSYGPYGSWSMNMTAKGNDVLSFSYVNDAVCVYAGFSAVLALDNVNMVKLENAPKASHKLTPEVIAGYALIGAAFLCALGWATMLWWKLRSARKQLRARTLEVMTAAGGKSDSTFLPMSERRLPPDSGVPRQLSNRDGPPPPPPTRRVSSQTAAAASPPLVPGNRPPPTAPSRASSQVTSPRLVQAPPPVPTTRPGQKLV